MPELTVGRELQLQNQGISMLQQSPANVTEIIVPADMCAGCGVCAGVCPSKSLIMTMHEGAYKPVLASRCLSKCTVCLTVCPFYSHDLSRDNLSRVAFGSQVGIKLDPIAGYYLESFVGYSNVDDHRTRGASGGMATWVMEYLLNSGEVDRIIAVRERDTDRMGSPLFEMAILDDIGDVRNAAGSKYHPVEISTCLREILKDKEGHRYAIVGLPCLLYSVRLAMQRYGRLRKQIVYLLGLVCSHSSSAYYTEAMSAWAGLSPLSIRTAKYRLKQGPGASWDYGFRAQSSSGKWSRQVGSLETYSHLRGRFYFALNACNYCEDVFAELADITFMDAWLPEYLADLRGTSILLVRNAQIASTLVAGMGDQSCKLRPCSIEDVKRSQDSVIERKREDIRQYLRFATECGSWVPALRSPLSETLSDADRRKIRCRLRTIRASRRIWSHYRKFPRFMLPLFFGIVDIYAGGLFYALKWLLIMLKKKVSRQLSVARHRISEFRTPSRQVRE